MLDTPLKIKYNLIAKDNKPYIFKLKKRGIIMAFCKNCGQQIPDDAGFCANCGTPVAATQDNTQQTTPVQPQVVYNGDDAQANKGIAWLSYLGLFFLIPMFVKKNSEYCKFHVKQGATLFCCEVVYWIAEAIIMAIINAIFPGYTIWGITVHSSIYNIFYTIFSIASIFFLVIAIIGIVNAVNGKKNELPLIGKIPFVATVVDKIYAALNK